MLRNYLKTALKVLIRRKFFTSVSLFGVGFTLMVLLVVAALVDHVLSPIAPEVNLRRTLHVSYLVRNGISEGSNWQSRSKPGYRLLDQYVRDIPGVERMSIYEDAQPVTSFVDGQKVVSSLRHTDGPYWQILEFEFLEGGPFTAEDERAGNFVAIISATTRRRIFADAPALHQSLEAGGQRFRVVGVVEDVPLTRLSAAADIWTPLCTARSQDFRHHFASSAFEGGGFSALLLARSRAEFAAIKAEFESRLAHVELEPPWTSIVGTPLTRLEQCAVSMETPADARPPVKKIILIILAMTATFLLLPTINLVSINLSRFMERTSEIGVRRAFGASAAHLVGQFVLENIILCVLAGAIALAGAALVLSWIEGSGLIPHAELRLNYRIFLYALGFAILFGLLSGAYPAWRTSRLHPVQALEGGRAMIRHLFKLVWNRRRANGLILAELLVAFLVLCGTLTMACYYMLNWQQPLGFAYRDLWRMDLTVPDRGRLTTEEVATMWANSEQIGLQLESMNEIRAASPLAPNFPYTNSYSGYRADVGGRQVFVCVSRVAPGALAALDLQLLAGRWLEPGDEELNWEPVVLTCDLAQAMFTDQDPLGQTIGDSDAGGINIVGDEDDEEEMAKERRVVGIVAAYRMRSALRPAYMTEFRLVDPTQGLPARTYAIRVHPGVSADFEEQLIRAIGQIAPEYTVTITPATRLRDRELRGNLIPLMILGIVAAFLITSAGLGLIGVLWQTVSRRTREIGLRRAFGATGDAIRWQILGELLALTTVAVFVGSVLFLQMPILHVITWLPWRAYLLSLGLSLGIIYAFVILCGLYPSWLATRVHPVEALQYE